MNELRGKNALVTGAGRRVGAAIAECLGAAGMGVAVHFNRTADGAEATCAAIRAGGGRAVPFQADLTDEKACMRLAQEVLAEFGGLDLLVASAASFERTPLAELDAKAMHDAFTLNVTAPVMLLRHCQEALCAARGSAVFITCTSPRNPYVDYLAYTVSKAALRQAVRNLALELAPDLRVNSIAPGTVLVPDTMPEQALQRELDRIPLGRAGVAEDVARAVHYLAEAPFVTGTELVVDGGRSI